MKISKLTFVLIITIVIMASIIFILSYSMVKQAEIIELYEASFQLAP